MPQQDGNARRITILASIAHAIYTHGRAILIAGTGEDLYGQDVVNVASEIDTIPHDTDGYRWANAAVRFIHWAVTIIQTALQEEHDENAAGMLAALNRNLDELLTDIENVDPDISNG